MIEIKTPFIYTTSDYHQFIWLQKALRDLSGLKLKYNELSAEKYGCFHAVFYQGAKPDIATINKLFKEKYSNFIIKP